MTKPENLKAGRWWDRAWSLVEGCTPVSPACEHCWAARATHMRARQSNLKIRARYEGLTTEDGQFNGQVRMMLSDMYKPRHVRAATTFAVWNDLFHPDVAVEFVQSAYDVMEACRQKGQEHIFIVCTKRPERLVSVLYGEEGGWYLGGGDYHPKTWHLTTVENQATADQRIPHLLRLREYSDGWPVLGLSMEPLLGPVTLPPEFLALGKRGWVIVGGETGPGARPMHPNWARSLRDQCQQESVPFFFKHCGEWSLSDEVPSAAAHYNDVRPISTGAHVGRGATIGGQYMVRIGKQYTGRLLDGRTWEEMPGA